MTATITDDEENLIVSRSRPPKKTTDWGREVRTVAEECGNRLTMTATITDDEENLIVSRNRRRNRQPKGP
jgi:hypothetical protein